VLSIDRRACDYQPFYCEENVWRLLRREELAGHTAWAVIVSSRAGRLVALWQKAGRRADGFVCWDYHVFAVVDEPGARLALDLDTDLTFPCPLGHYVQESFPHVRDASAQPCFRVIAATDYAAQLATDRSHMRSPDGSYIKPPPLWPAPGPARTNTFLSWLDLSADGPGELFNLDEMLAFARTPTEPSP
jgi:protein N-terminal glutamine amidohydrolase